MSVRHVSLSNVIQPSYAEKLIDPFIILDIESRPIYKQPHPGL